MRAIAYRKHGQIEELQEVDIPEPKTGRNRVLVAVHSIGLNPLDYRLRRGEMGKLTAFSKPKLIGSDFSGHVLEVGSHVADLSKGDRVYGMVFQPLTGTSADRISVKRQNLSQSPFNVDDTTAATIPLAALTAYQSLHNLAHLQADQRVLLNGASGGVGTYGLQLAKIAGAHVTAVTSHRNADWVQELGADKVIDYTQHDFTLMDATYDVIFDAYGNRSFPEARACLTEKGVYISTIPSVKNFGQSMCNMLRGPQNKIIMVKSVAADLDNIRALVESGKLKPIVDSQFERDQIHAAYAKLETKRARGKIGVRMKVP
ncbi:MAG: NAD(P)-dependent alcohol dehydrogenase [Myxococcota bacterium]|nr:NAD(P)-dependent alcohol dehydrogenase [Myxococcota bacterium]